MPGLLIALTTGAGLVVIAVSLVMLAVMATAPGFGPNMGIGIRTRATKSSPEAWRAGHVAARPWLIVAGAVALAVAVADLVLVAAGVSADVILIVAMSTYAGALVLVVVGALRANRAARSVADEHRAGG